MDVAHPSRTNATRTDELAPPIPDQAEQSDQSLQIAAPRPLAGVALGGLKPGPVGGLFVQAKLAVGASADPLEAEADAVAQHVVEQTHGAPSDPAAVARRLDGMRRTDAGHDEHEHPVARRLAGLRQAGSDPIGAEGGELGGGVEAMLRRQAGGGEPLSAPVRRSMESAMDADFGSIRVHSGPEAAALNEQMSARAFTVDNHVFFRDGLPDTASPDGKHLLAHELAHTVQQGSATARRSTIRRHGGHQHGSSDGGSTGVLDHDDEHDPNTKQTPVAPTQSGPKKTTTLPPVLHMDSGGVGHDAPEKSKAPPVLFMDSGGVGHKKPDGSKTPPVLYMDDTGVGHKKTDGSQTPTVLHMDDKGVGHDKADEVAPAVKLKFDEAKALLEFYLPQAAIVTESGTKWEGFEKAGADACTAAGNARTLATPAWDTEADDSGLIAAQQAVRATTASATAGKAKTDAHALDAGYDTAWKLAVGKHTDINKLKATLATEKVKWLKDASPMTTTAITAIQSNFDDLWKAAVATTKVNNARPTRLKNIDDSATDASVIAGELAAPLAKGAKRYVITAILQQKLNMANGKAGRITVTGGFDDDTVTALKKFQKANGLGETGIADVATWTALNAAAPSSMKNGQLRVDDEDKSATARPVAGVHPKLSFPTNGGAVRELQQRLNNWHATIVGKKPFSEITIDGIFGIKTRSAVKEFQRAHGLKTTAVVEDTTWAELDKMGTITSGVQQFQTLQICEGMLTGGQARYNWDITKDNRLVITVKINFTGEKKHPKVQSWLQDITDVWNGYKATEIGGARSYDIEFRPVVSGSAHHKVRVGKPTKKNPNPRSDSANWYVDDTRKGLAPHEFGHLVGLDDEYNRPEEQYVETTGQEPAVGSMEASGGKTPTQVADLIWTALLNSERGAATSTAVADIVRNEGITQGSFARSVVKDFLQKHPYTKGFLDYVQGGPRPATFTTYLAYLGDNDWTGDLTEATEAFSESNTSIMGTMESVPDNSNAGQIAGIAPHDHPVQPRHLRSFTDLLVKAFPGSKWKPVKR